MRYLVIFDDRTTKRVNQDSAKIFMEAMRTRQPVFYRGCAYSGRSIKAVKTTQGYYEDKRREVEERGGFYCIHGREHPNRADCACKDAKIELLVTEEELRMLANPNADLPLLISSPKQL